MSTDDLNQAIQLIQQSQPQQAQPILQALIKANQQDLAAWSWYVKSFQTPEQRLKALEMCLKFNPGNPQILEAIQKLQAKLSIAQPTPAFTSFAPVESLAGPQDNMNAYAAVNAAIPSTTGATDSLEPPREFSGLDDSPGRPFMWHEVLLTALTQANVNSYSALLRDPLASPGRAYWWVFMSGMITGLIFILLIAINPTLIPAMEELEQLEGGEGIGTTLGIILLILVPIGAAFSVLGLILGAALYNFLAKLLGGSGNFSRTVYLLGAYSAPLSILSGVLGLIPLVNCLTVPLAGYSFWLSVTSIQAAHRLNGGRSVIVIMIPSLVILMFICLVLIVGGQALMETLQGIAVDAQG